MNTLSSLGPWLPGLILLAIWETIWKLIALWKAGRNKQLAWFVVIGIINSAGIIPIVYILFFQAKNSKR